MKIKDSIRSIIPNRIKEFVNYGPESPYETICYSQNGEDIILNNLFGGKRSGFYIDVGAHHPFRFSNTYLFYKMGWNGINIDPLPETMKIFDRYRPNDINIEVGVAQNSGSIPYYMFNHPAMNTFSKELADERNKVDDPIQMIKQINVLPLSEILDQYLIPHQKIDFLNVDVEGFDYEVLSSNNWTIYRPTVIIYEELDLSNKLSILNSKISNLLNEVGYSYYTRVYNSIIFKLNNKENN